MLEIVTATVIFSSVVLLLVMMLMFAKTQLVPEGEALLLINDEPGKALKAPIGSTLLGALAANKVFIPAACGGKGSCGVCKVTVLEGGGALLPTETGFIKPAEARSGMRLACQVKVKGNLKIELAPELFDVRKWNCRVLSNRNVSTFIKELKLALPEGEEVPFRAGGYVQIECPPHQLSFRDFDIEEEFRAEWDKFDLWRFKSKVDEPVVRAYSLANYPEERGILLFTIRIVFPPEYREDIPPGMMSSWLFKLRPGDMVTVSGPFGEFYARDTDREMCFVGAGAGMAPMRSHILDQLLRLKTKRKMSFWYSCRNISEAFYVEEFNKLQAEHPNFTWHLIPSEPRPEDNYKGPTGLVRNKVLRTAYLDHHPAPEDIEFYMCGPDVMNKAVTKMCLDLGVDRENIMYDDFGL
jgi:Na+-transporting NADH:ubiquinone oxidoreductase subunit F